MPRSPEDVCDAILRAYFERRCATARALSERPGVESKPEELPWNQELFQDHERDKLLLQWLSSDAPLDFRCQMSRRMLVAWMLEHTSVTQPHRVLDLLQFDMHYLHVLQFSSILAKSRPVGIDPMSLEERGAFKKRLIEIFWRPKTDQTKYPDPVTLLRLFGHLVERLQEKPVLPPIEGVDEPLVSPPPKVMSYDSVELERAVELKDLEKLEDLVVRARLTWFGLPGELADSYARSYHEVSPETVTDRIAGRLTDIAQLVEAEKFKQAATMILSCMFSSGEKDPYDAARKKLDEARKALQGVPEVFFLDHRNWETLDAAPVKRSPAALLSFSHIAQLEGVTTEDIAALDL